MLQDSGPTSTSAALDFYLSVYFPWKTQFHCLKRKEPGGGLKTSAVVQPPIIHGFASIHSASWQQSPVYYVSSLNTLPSVLLSSKFLEAPKSDKKAWVRRDSVSGRKFAITKRLHCRWGAR